MQYVRSLGDSVSTAWNSINPATLSGAIDVIVVEQEDGSYRCSPFHVRFGKFSLLRPSEKKVEFKVNGVKQEYSMKLGEGGEAFFVFETTERIPQSMQTSPIVSPAGSPELVAEGSDDGDLPDVDVLRLDEGLKRPGPSVLHGSADEHGMMTPTYSTSPNLSNGRPASGDWQQHRPYSDDVLRRTARASTQPLASSEFDDEEATLRERSTSPPPLAPKEAVERAQLIAQALSAANIPSEINSSGDIMLDMTSFKTSEDDMLKAEITARKILSEKLDGNYDIGALFGFDEEGNLWIYSSEEARAAAMKKTMEASLGPHHHHRRTSEADAVSDPGYHSDGSDVTNTPPPHHGHRRSESDAGPSNMQTPPRTPTGDIQAGGDPNRNYAKTLRLTSEQLKDLQLLPGENSMSFTVNRATCSAKMYLWKHETPVVISDIDGTITKSDALGHVLNMIGRDWTHTGVAKLYTDIAQNGYNIMYLTSRSVGQSDTTRQYLYNIIQDGYRLPHGPTILSPDRTMAALRREIYLRKPHIFKMATLRDIRSLYGPDRTPFTAGFGNRLTDQISYRTVDVPRNRIFTINSNAEVSLDLLSLNKMKMSYVNINEVVDHYFPPVSTLVKGGGEEFTDFKYWRDVPLDMDDFSASGSDDDEDEDEDDDDEEGDEGDEEEGGEGSVYYDEEGHEAMGDSYISRDSYDGDSLLSESLILEERRARKKQTGAHDDDDEEYDEGLAYGEEDDDEPVSEDDDEAHLDYEANVHASPTSPKKKKSDRREDVVEDASAEIITGINVGAVNPSKIEAKPSTNEDAYEDSEKSDSEEDEEEEENQEVQRGRKEVRRVVAKPVMIREPSMTP